MTETETVLRARRPSDLLAFVSFRLGFNPEHSLVAVALTGPRRRVGLVVRADLPPPGQQEDQVCRYLARTLRSCGAAASAVIVYTSYDWGDAGSEPRPRLRRAAQRALRCAGAPAVDVLHVGPTAYRSYLCTDPGCCPYPGHSVTDLTCSEVAAHLVLLGHAVAAHRSDLLPDLRPVGPDELAAVHRCADAWSERAATMRAADDRAARSGRSGDAAREALQDWRTSVLRRWKAVVRGHREGLTMGSEEAGELLAGLQDVRVRDAVLLEAGSDPQAGLTLLGHREGSQLAHRLLDAFLATPPQPTVVGGVQAVLVQLARRAGGSRQAPALASHAWLDWWRGEPVPARELAALALDADPTYRLAHLVRSALDSGLRPRWATQNARRRG